jgi:endonuclease/exonuclease/phosphatase family metal-dependent hydrolase
VQPLRPLPLDASPGPGPFAERHRLRATRAAVLGLVREVRRGAPWHGHARQEEGRSPPPGPGDLRVASYNIHKCVGTDGRFNPGRIAQVLAELGADVVALQEVDRRFGRRTGLLDAGRIERATGLVPLRVSDLPDGLGWHGNGLLVRPGTAATRLRRIALPGAEPRGAVVAELAPPGAEGGTLRVIAAHFGLLRRCRARQAAAILEAVAQGGSMPTLLLGDLNEWRPDGGGRSALQALEPLFGPVAGGPPSFPSRLPLLALDRILGCPRALVRQVEAHDSPLARIASDHLPLKAWIRLGAAADALAAPLAAAA